MKNLALALCAIVLAVPAFAQSPDAASPDAAPAPAAGPADQGVAGDAGDAGGGGKGSAKSKMKEVMQSCRKSAKGQGLKGHDLREAVVACVSKDNPAMAGRVKCRMDAMDKGLKAGSDELKASVKDCMRKSG